MDEFEAYDYAAIAQAIGQTPNQCMKKLLEIKSNGTLRPGVWSTAEDDELTA
jgi:hypothetical protein